MSKQPPDTSDQAMQLVLENGEDAPQPPKQQATVPTLLMELRFGMAVLLVWWGVWTIADRTLVRFSPFSEIAAIAMGIAMYTWDKTRRAIHRAHQSVNNRVSTVLQRI